MIVPSEPSIPLSSRASFVLRADSPDGVWFSTLALGVAGTTVCVEVVERDDEDDEVEGAGE